MKKILIAAICSLLVCGALFAQSASVEEFCKKLSVHENMVGNFVQEKTIAKTNRSLKSTGRFIFCPEGFVWETQKPFKVSMIVTKKSLIQIGADGKKKIMDGSSNPTFTSISSKVGALFSGDAAVLTNDFTVDYKSANGKWEAVLTPKSKSVAGVMKSILISGSESANEATIEKIVMTESNNNTTGYYLSEQRYPKELSANEKAYFAEK